MEFEGCCHRRGLKGKSLSPSLRLWMMGSFKGPLAGAAVLCALPEILRFAGFSDAVVANMRLLIYGLHLVLIAHFRPQGIAEYRLEKEQNAILTFLGVLFSLRLRIFPRQNPSPIHELQNRSNRPESV